MEVGGEDHHSPARIASGKGSFSSRHSARSYLSLDDVFIQDEDMRCKIMIEKVLSLEPDEPLSRTTRSPKSRSRFEKSSSFFLSFYHSLQNTENESIIFHFFSRRRQSTSHSRQDPRRCPTSDHQVHPVLEEVRGNRAGERKGEKVSWISRVS